MINEGKLTICSLHFQRRSCIILKFIGGCCNVFTTPDRKTYPIADYEKIWEAFDAAAELWNILGNDVAVQCHYSYPVDTENNMLRLIRNIL